MPAVGSKLQVFRGNADHTSGGLHKSDLMKNKQGKIVSKKQHEAGKLAFKRNGLTPLSAAGLASIRP